MYRLFSTLLVFIVASQNAWANLDAAAALDKFNRAVNHADYQSALEDFRSLYQADSNDPEIAFYLGRSLYHLQELEEADEILSKNISRHPNHVESHYVLGSVKLSRVGLVNVFRKISMAKAAISAWEQTVSLDPAHVEAQYGVVEFYLNAPGVAGGDEDKGLENLKHLATMSQPWADLSAASRALRNESFSDAEQLFKRAIAGIPNRAFPQLMLANAYIRQEKYEEALAALKTYKKRQQTWNDPGLEPTELMAARIYLGLGDEAQARQSLRLVLDNHPPQGLREQAEELFESLKES